MQEAQETRWGVDVDQLRAKLQEANAARTATAERVKDLAARNAALGAQCQGLSEQVGGIPPPPPWSVAWLRVCMGWGGGAMMSAGDGCAGADRLRSSAPPFRIRRKPRNCCKPRSYVNQL